MGSVVHQLEADGIDSEGCKGVLLQQMSHEKKAPGCLRYVRDEKLPNYMAIFSETMK